jgi:hypothetical protein
MAADGIEMSKAVFRLITANSSYVRFLYGDNFMRKLILLAYCVILSSCATVEVRKITESTYSDGLRFYRPEPYLLVTKDAEGKLQTSLIYLPNKTEEYVLRTVPGIGAIEMNATLADGWKLTDIGAKIDSKVPETITALSGALTAAGGMGVARRQLPLDPGLYRIDFDKGTGYANRLVGPLELQAPR